MAELGNRIRQALQTKGISQAELARRIGVKQQTISYLCAMDSPATTTRYATKIAQVLGVNPAWLQTGEGDPDNPVVHVVVEGVEVLFRRVPLFKVVDSLLRYLKGKPAKAASVGIITNLTVSDRVFAVEVTDSSMAPIFESGDRVVFDPEIKPEPGDYVLALVSEMPVLRKFRMKTGGVYELAPMNADWPTLTSSEESITILGVMVEHRRYRKHSH